VAGGGTTFISSLGQPSINTTYFVEIQLVLAILFGMLPTQNFSILPMTDQLERNLNLVTA